MGMPATWAHCQPDTAVNGAAGRQQAKAFHTPPKHGLRSSAKPELPLPPRLHPQKSDLCVAANTYNSVASTPGRRERKKKRFFSDCLFNKLGAST